MNTFLSKIIAHKKEEIQVQKGAIQLNYFKQNIIERSPISLKKALIKSKNGIIAEFKRSSPSKGEINKNAILLDTIQMYEKMGAAALSILTDRTFFKGSLYDIKKIRPHTKLPILRKDFIIDEYQLYQAKHIGADAILLIASATSVKKCINLANKAHELGLEVLLEIHSKKELKYLNCQPDIVGINNRNLHTFNIDLEISIKLIQKIPPEFLIISESGISNYDTIKKLKKIGFKGFLIGSALMMHSDKSSILQNTIDP